MAMAAAAGVVGLVVGALVAWVVAERQARQERHRADGLEHTVHLLDGQLTMLREAIRAEIASRQEMLDRLLDAALPKREEQVEERPGSPAEYEPPPPQVSDWTDPFIGLERGLVGGLAPGQAIPGIGVDDGVPTDEVDGDLARYEWEADHPEARGMEAFADWEAQEGPPRG